MNVAVFGTGYVGLAITAVLAHIGHTVTCVDRDTDRLVPLSSGGLELSEPFVAALMQGCPNRIRYTTDAVRAAAENQVLIVAEEVAVGPDGALLLHPVDSLLSDIGSGMVGPLSPRTVVIVTTMPLGYANRAEQLLRATAPDADFTLAVNPEFISRGTAVRDSLYPTRIIIGSNSSNAVATLRHLYGPIIDQRFHPVEGLKPPAGQGSVQLLVMDTASAELAKQAVNAFIATKISFINEIANVAESARADVGLVAQVLSTDPRIGPHFLKAGLGYGGNLFPQLPKTLHEIMGKAEQDLPLLTAVMTVNRGQCQWVLRKLKERVKPLADKKVAMLGLAYKPGTDDLRGSPALKVAQMLWQEGTEVCGHDPLAGANAAALMPYLRLYDNVYAAAAGAHALIIITDWPEYRQLDWEQIGRLMKQPVILDGRRMLADMPLKHLRPAVLGTWNGDGP